MKLIPVEARFPDLHDQTIELFSDVQLEYVACELCGDYHPPEIHIRATTPFDLSDPEDA
jgi:hypothetical protein